MNRNKIRFCKQRDQYSCGPVALLNVDKFYGKQVTYANLPHYKKLVDCSHPNGTRTRSMSNVLGRASRKNWQRTKDFLDGGCLIIQTGDGIAKHPGHYSIILKDIHGTYILVNHYHSKGYASIITNWQVVYWLWQKAYRIWYVKTAIQKGCK